MLILMRGSASDVLLAAHDFYATAGFTPDSNATLHDTSYRIVLVAENRDHSASETQLVVAVSGIPPTPGAPALKARILRGPHRIGLAAARRSGLQVAFIAPAAARLAIVHAFRKIGAGRRAIGSRSDAVHAGRNVIALDSPSFRNALRPGRYQVEIVLRATAGGPGEPVRVPVVIR